MEIQSRDIRYLRLAYDHGFFLAEHAARYFKDFSNLKRRLRKLAAAKLITKHNACAWNQAKVIKLTQAGRYAVEEAISYRIPYPVPIKDTRLLHDAQMISARQRLDELWDGEFIPEALLPKDRDVPDGIYSFPSARKFYVELENSHKATQRFLGRLDRFREATAVLYIATRPEVDRSIRKSLATNPMVPAALISLHDLNHENPQVWSTKDLSLFHRKDF